VANTGLLTTGRDSNGGAWDGLFGKLGLGTSAVQIRIHDQPFSTSSQVRRDRPQQALLSAPSQARQGRYRGGPAR